MLNLDREQAIALGALGTLLLGCALAVGASIATRSVALQELADRQDLIARLQVQAVRPSETHGRLVAGTAPPDAFIDAPTAGLAAAQLQTHIENVAAEQHATLLSSGMEATAREDAPDAIRLQATLELKLKSLQAMLYRLESGMPYVFVETFAVQPSTTEGGDEDPSLRLTIGVRAIWRRGQT
jgi:general secretion pathway protein M